MEPMALGSPTQSPKNNPLGFSSNAPFLPSFLMGEQQSSTTPRHGSLSPTKSRPSGLFRSPSSLQPETPDRVFRPSFYQQENESLSIPKQPVSEKSGPPVKGLFDTLDSRYKYEPNNVHSPDISRIGTPTRSTSNYESFQNSTINTFNDRYEKLTSTPNCHQNLNESVNFNQNRMTNLSTDTWVTVLGFPSATTNMILAHFGQCGTILEKKFPTQGNWVHLRYATSFEASKALAFNGKVLANCIMVGVIPFRPQEHANKENITMTPELMNSSTYSSTFTSPVRSARPLTTSFLAQQGNSNTNEITSPVPQKSTGLVTKAMEYVFGW